MKNALKIAVLSLWLMVMACNSTPSYVIAPDDMAEVLADIHTGEAIVESSGSSFNTDSSRQALKQEILARHGVTLEKFDTSLYWYGQHVEKFIEVNDKSIDILTARIAQARKLGNAAATVTRFNQDGDSVDLWNGPTAVYLNDRSPSRILTFNYSSDRNWERGDIYTLSLKPIDNQSPVKATIAAEYSDGTAEYTSADLNREGINRLYLYLDSAKVAVNVYGAISYNPAAGENAYIDSISIIRSRAKTNSLHDNASGQNVIRYR